MKDIEKIVNEFKTVFDDAEPSEGHFERFESKLTEFNHKKKSFTLGFALKAAAVAVLVVLSGLWVYDNVNTTRFNKGIALSEISAEYGEVEMYYTHLVNEKYTEINNFAFPDSIQKQLLMYELNQMDSMYENLKKDLTTNPSDQRVINAMIQHYQLKVDVMNQILNQLQQAQNIKTQKSDNYESTEI
jgi:hypothetical protein